MKGVRRGTRELSAANIKLVMNSFRDDNGMSMGRVAVGDGDWGKQYAGL